MQIILSKQSSKPIYEQIEYQIKQMIMSEALKSGDKLPSIRELAKSLQISVITTQRAYEDLQKEGYIETIHGRGTFISSSNTSFILEEQLKVLQEKIEEIIALSKVYGIKREELIESFNAIYESEEEDK